LTHPRTIRNLNFAMATVKIVLMYVTSFGVVEIYRFVGGIYRFVGGIYRFVGGIYRFMGGIYRFVGGIYRFVGGI